MDWPGGKYFGRGDDEDWGENRGYREVMNTAQGKESAGIQKRYTLCEREAKKMGVK